MLNENLETQQLIQQRHHLSFSRNGTKNILTRKEILGFFRERREKKKKKKIELWKAKKKG